MSRVYCERSIWVIPKDFLTGKYLQLRLIIRSRQAELPVTIFNKNGNLPFLITQFVKYGPYRKYRTAIIFIQKSLLDKDTEIKLLNPNVGALRELSSVSIFNDDSNKAVKAYIKNH